MAKVRHKLTSAVRVREAYTMSYIADAASRTPGYTGQDLQHQGMLKA